jgi:hypothetical protein
MLKKALQEESISLKPLKRGWTRENFVAVDDNTNSVSFCFPSPPLQSLKR